MQSAFSECKVLGLETLENRFYLSLDGRGIPLKQVRITDDDVLLLDMVQITVEKAEQARTVTLTEFRENEHEFAHGLNDHVVEIAGLSDVFMSPCLGQDVLESFFDDVDCRLEDRGLVELYFLIFDVVDYGDQGWF